MEDEPGEDDDVELYSNIRQLLGKFIGKRIADITQHDPEEWAEDQKAYVMLMFEDGGYIQFFIGDDGFCTDEDRIERDDCNEPSESD